MDLVTDWPGRGLLRFALAVTTKQVLLRRAAALIGHEELAARLEVPSALLESWIGGQATMPDRKLIALTKILDEIAGPPASG